MKKVDHKFHHLLERSISNQNSKKRYYFDYNATSPYAESVIEWLKQGDFAFANPSSLHTSGRKAKKMVHEVEDYLLNLFGLKNSHEILFHSGATEGINTIVKGLSRCLIENNKHPIHFYYGSTDHSVLSALALDLNCCGHQTETLKINHCGDLNVDDFLHKASAVGPSSILLNYTWVNNETGVVWPLEMANKLKEETGCFVHIDAVQAPGKIENFQSLSPLLDAYTFSGHKFGALKGIGFTFIRKGIPFVPLIIGGGQQKGYRSGTENTLGIYSLKLAFEELIKNFDYSSLSKAKTFIEEKLKSFLGDRGIIIGEQAQHRNANTITLALKNTKSDILITAFDMSGVDLSGGSACSSGSILPNRVLLNMGISEELARGALRISFSPYFKEDQVDEYYSILEKTFSKILT